MLLDSDDWLELDCIESLVKIAEEGDFDIVGTGSLFRDSETKQVIRMVGTEERTILNEKNIVDYMVENLFAMYLWWGKLYKTDIINQISLTNLIKQTHGVTLYAVDVACALECIKLSKSICIDNSFLHNYFVCRSSTSHKKYDYDRCNLIEIGFDMALEFVSGYSINDSEKMKLPYRMYADGVDSLIWLLSEKLENGFTASEILHELYRIFKLKHFQLIYNHIEYSFIEKSRKLFITFVINQASKIENGIKNDEYKEILIYFIEDISKLCNIETNQLLSDYNYAYLLFEQKKYDEALEYITEVLIKNGSDNEDFINLYITIAAAQERVNEFIFGKIKLAECYALKERYYDCKIILDEITDMGVEDDEEITKLKRMVNANISF